MFLRLSSFAAAALVPISLHATEHEIETYGTILDTCYAAATGPDDLKACIGQMSGACMEAEEGGYSTLGMSSCTNAEAQAWDRYLNLEYKATVAGLRAMDTEEAAYFPEFAKRVENLRTAQRAWITFRDSECGLAYAMWGSGSMRNIAWASCQLEMTATRTIELKFLGEEMR